MEAARSGDVELLESVPVERLSGFGIMSDGSSLLDVAMAHGQAGVVQCLVRRSVESGVDFVGGWTMGHAAAYAGDLGALGGLSGEELRANSGRGESLLHAAAWGGNMAAVERLVELGLDPHATTRAGTTCLHYAAWGGHVAAIERLVEMGVDPRTTAISGRTCLHFAAHGGHVAAIKRLAELGVDPLAVDNDGSTALHFATFLEDCARAIPLLLQLGVNPSLKDNDGNTVLDHVLQGSHLASAAPLGGSGWVVQTVNDEQPKFIDSDELPEALVDLTALTAVGPVNTARLEPVFAAWPRLQSLQVLHLRGLVSVELEEVTSRLGDLSDLHHLTLEFMDVQSASAAALATILALPLRSLELSRVQFDEATALSGCVSLSSLTLLSCTLSSVDLDAMASLPQLQRLVLTGSRFPSLDPLGAGCHALRCLDVRDCELTSAPAFLTSLPRLQQLFVAQNPFVYELREYRHLIRNASGAIDFLRTLSLSSEGKSRDVAVVLVGHGRAGKSQIIQALLHALTAEPETVENVPLVAERTSMVESGMHSLQLAVPRADALDEVDEFEARFFDTPGQMEFFASNMTVIAPLLPNSVVVAVVRCVPHGVDGATLSLVREKRRIASEFRLWLAEVSRAVVGAERANRDTYTDEPVVPAKRADVLLVLTHRDVLDACQGEAAVGDVEAWLESLSSELRDEFSDTLEVRSAVFVDATAVGKHDALRVHKQLAAVAHSVFVRGPLLPGVLVDVRALVVSEEVRRMHVCERETLEDLLLSRFGERGLTPGLSRLLLEVLESNGSVLRTPGRQLVVVDPGWISRVMSSLYVDPKRHDEANFNGDPSEFDALAAFDTDGEVQAGELRAHLRLFVDDDDELLERLLVVLVSNGIAIPLRMRPDLKGVPVVESYLIVGRWMDAEDGDGSVRWSSSRLDEASWFELVVGCLYSLKGAASAFALASSLRQQPSFRLMSLRCETRVPLGPSFLTRLVHRLSTLLRSSRHSFLVRRAGIVCLLPFTRFHAALHVRLPSSADVFELTMVAARDDVGAALEFVLLECALPVLRMLALGERDHWLRVKQRCSACVATREDLTSHARHDRELATGEAVCDDVEAVRALCSEVLGDGRNWQYDECRGCGGALSTVEVEAAPSSFSDSFVPDIPPASVALDDASVLGSGQFGSVMKGEYNGTDVVLKELKVSSGEALLAFKREAQLLGRASRHPCISLLLGMCSMSKVQVYMVMEHAGVCDLEEALCKPAEKPLLGAAWDEFGVLVGVLVDVASALRHLHSQDPPLLHNDVALRNVLVRHENGRNRAKLTDMGLARVAPRGSVHKLAKGTKVPKWQMAPETLEFRVVSPASDVFQFGMLVYEVLARQRPFAREWRNRESRASLVEDIKRGRRPLREDVVAAGAHCDDSLWQLVEECWHDSPLERPSMATVSARLARLARQQGGVPREQVPLRKPPGHTEPPQPHRVPAPIGEQPPAPEPAPPPPAPSAPPLDVPHWTADDTCTWLLQLGIPSCVELVPLFRHNGVDGEILLDLSLGELVELGVARLPARVLLKARDKLHSA